MSGTITPFSSQYFGQQVQPGSIAQIQQALAMAQQRAAIQRAQMQAMQQQAAQQQQAMLQASAIPGPATAPGYQPGQPLPLAGSQPMPVAGGGAPMITQQGVQGQVPFSQNGVPMPNPRAFSGAPGGRNAPGGANPFSIQPGGNQGLIQTAIREYAQQQSNPFGFATGTSTNTDPNSYQSVIAQLQKLGPSSIL